LPVVLDRVDEAEYHAFDATFTLVGGGFGAAPLRHKDLAVATRGRNLVQYFSRSDVVLFVPSPVLSVSRFGVSYSEEKEEQIASEFDWPTSRKCLPPQMSANAADLR